VLFDLRSGKRRRMVQITFTGLAVTFLLGFIGFGIGVGGGPGGIFDALGLGSGSSGGSTASAFDQQISNAQKRVQKNPKDEAALLSLARYQYLAGQSQLSADSNGVPVVGDASHSHFVDAVDAWTRYLKVASKPDPIIAGQIAQSYAYLNDATGAAKAQEIFAKAKPSQNSYGQLALYLYAKGEISGGDAAAKKAVALAPKATRKQLEKQLAALGKRAQKYKQAQAAAAKAGGGSSAGGQALQNPFGGLGPTSSPTGVTP
jgi:hypothetical protein